MSDWIEWNGGECPVPRETLVEVRFRGGVKDLTPTSAWVRLWGHVGGAYDIVAYRVIEERPQPDPVNHPAHYTAGSVECIDAIKAALTPEEFRGFCKGNALKYVWRERMKGGNESLAKAQWYLAKLEGEK